MQPHDTTTPTKVCTKCGKELPATLEYFHRNKKARDGYAYRCKDCQHKTKRKYREKNREYVLEGKRSYYRNNRDKILAKQKEYRENNKEEKAKRDHIYYQNHKEEKAAYDREYISKNRERIAKRSRIYRRNNPLLLRAIQHRRKARKRDAEGSHTGQDIGKQYDAQSGRCYYCNKKVGDNFHVDHVIPLARGGSDGPENIVIACPDCNHSKKDKLPSEWPQGGRLI